MLFQRKAGCSRALTPASSFISLSHSRPLRPEARRDSHPPLHTLPTPPASPFLRSCGEGFCPQRPPPASGPSAWCSHVMLHAVWTAWRDSAWTLTVANCFQWQLFLDLLALTIPRIFY